MPYSRIRGIPNASTDGKFAEPGYRPNWIYSIRRRPRWALVGALGLGTAVCLILSYVLRSNCPWLSDLLLNVGASFFVFLPAVFVVDWLVVAHDERQWEPVSHHIGFYARRVANLIAYAYRVAEGIGDASLPREQLEADALRGMADWISDVILPGLNKLDRLDQSGWERLASGLTDADTEAREILLLHGVRLKPTLYEQLIKVQRSIYRAHNTLRDFSPVLGVPSQDVRIEPTARIYDFIVHWQAHYSDKPYHEVVDDIRKAGLLDAKNGAREVLAAAITLLEETIPLLPPEGSRLPTSLDAAEPDSMKQSNTS